MEVLHISKIDWSKNSLCVGVQLPPTDEAPWLELSNEDIRMLHLTLTRMMPMEEHGRIVYVEPLTERSAGLKQLNHALEAMMKWQAARLAGSPCEGT